MIKGMIAAAVVAMSAASANAVTLAFESNLTGDQEPGGVVTNASGYAKVVVDTDAETVSVNLSVTGITIAGLFDDLVAAPVGPVHLHNAAVGVNGPIAVPFGFNTFSNYIGTPSGFDLVAENLSYADANGLVGGGLSFDAFLTELQNDRIYFNVHTDDFAGGEIRGVAAAVPLPASALFLLTSLGGIAAVRRKLN